MTFQFTMWKQTGGNALQSWQQEWKTLQEYGKEGEKSGQLIESERKNEAKKNTQTETSNSNYKNKVTKKKQLIIIVGER